LNKNNEISPFELRKRDRRTRPTPPFGFYSLSGRRGKNRRAKDRKNYYEALKTVDPQTQDMTRWLEYFAQGIAVSAQEVKQKVWELSDGARGKYQTARRQTELTPRQSKIVAYINQHDSIANSQTQKLLGVSRQMATKELANLVDTKLIKKLGSFKDARYKLLHF